MADTTVPSTTAPPATNGTFPAEDAAGQTVAAIVEADKISAGKSD
jgi:ubiquitin-like 1-activating enzyme E1 A